MKVPLTTNISIAALIPQRCFKPDRVEGCIAISKKANNIYQTCFVGKLIHALEYAPKTVFLLF